MSKIARMLFSQRLLLLIWGLVIGGGFIFLGITAYNGGPTPQFEPPGSPIYLRGRGIALLRLPATIVPPQDVEIFDDARVVRGLNPDQPGKTIGIHLSPSEQEELNQLRVQWCQHVPEFPPVMSNEPFYDLGFKCDASYHVKQAKVPVDMLPAVFTRLLVRLPPISDP